MPHYNSTGKEGDDTWEADDFTQEIADITIEKNEARLFEGVFDKGLINF